MNLSRALIWSALFLTTGWRAPAYCQSGPITAEANVGAGWGHGLARTWTDEPSCVYENTGHPFSGLRGFGDVHEHGDCSDPDLYHHHSFGTTSCWLESWDIVPGEAIESQLDIYSASLAWSPTGELLSVSVSACDGFSAMGRWTQGTYQLGTPPLPGQPSWEEFTAGEPIVIRLPWSTANESFFFDYAQRWEERGENNPTWEVWEILYDGYRPWESDLDVTIEWTGGGLTFAGEVIFGGHFVLAVTPVAPQPMADLTRNGEVSVADLFAFLGDYFAGYMRADWTHDSAVGSADIFAFLADWFGSD